MTAKRVGEAHHAASRGPSAPFLFVGPDLLPAMA